MSSIDELFRGLSPVQAQTLIKSIIPALQKVRERIINGEIDIEERCIAIAKNGKQCGVRAMKSDIYCQKHSPKYQKGTRDS